VKLRVALTIPCAVLALATATARGAEDVAVILGETVTRSELDGPGGTAGELQRLHDLVWRRALRHYVGENALHATDDEVAELAAYHREFERKDRAQRARKLEELNQRLAAKGLDGKQREWLEEFRAVLTRLARHDAGIEGLPGPDAEARAAMFGPVIELWKTNVSIYERYGGVVALTRFGPDPQGARRALIEDYERQGLIRFHDPALRERLFARLAARPSVVVPAAEVDFTPYWRRPIPPSYFPDEAPPRVEKRDP
jgi:hypothetical protein